MRPSLRFIAIVVIGWIGFRAVTSGALPASMFSFSAKPRALPPIAATQFPPIDPVEPAQPMAPSGDPLYAQLAYAQAPQALPVRPVLVPVYYSAPAAPVSSAPPPPTRLANALPTPSRYYSDLPPLEQWPGSRIASIAHPASSSIVVQPGQSIPVWVNPKKIDRLQLTTWAMLRAQQSGVAGSTSLAPGGELGASQAGARLTYNFTRQIAASLRTTTAVGRRGGEVAGGVRVQPLVSVPVWITAERRQRIGRFGGGRNAFALFLEGGVYQHPMPWAFNLDAYLEGGVVGVRSRDLFVDGALTLTRPVHGRFSAGVGVWGGAQPGLYRIDAGPRVTMQVRRNIRVHLDWRQRIAGNARPGSGPALTLAGDF